MDYDKQVSGRKITNTTLHDFMVECYRGYRLLGAEKEGGSHEFFDLWKKNMSNQFKSPLIASLPAMMNPVIAQRLPWIINSLEPNNIAKVSLICPQYQMLTNRLIVLMTSLPIQNEEIEQLLTEMEEIAVGVLMYATD